MDVDWGKIYNDYNFIKNQDDELITSFMLQNINNNNGWVLNRIGGSDYEAVFEYIKVNKNMKLYNLKYHMNMTKSLNGYFDKSTDDKTMEQNFINYLEKMYNCYANSDSFTNPCATIQNNFNNYDFNMFNKLICKDKQLIHFYYIESIYPFLKDFKIFAENKKILIVSPFSESIKYQTMSDRINNLINDYEFPNCTFLMYDTPITYNSVIDDLNKVTTNNWLEQCEKMENDIQNIDFDIALLSCGSYANCLGSFIARKMNKKAIYIGGPLNVLFNIFGKRYDDKFYNNINNLAYRITALEKDNYLDTKGGKSLKNESFNAYF
jgi:hypothetical protein